jgi:endonuclease/exonuclease/phosphatase family metal-dependent hydrolase
MKKVLPGDWNCNSCNFSNFASRFNCKNCGNSKQLPGDWTCSCGFNNFASRKNCFKCEKQKEDSMEIENNYKKDWKCLICKFDNLSTQSSCKSCSAPKDELSDWICSFCQQSNFRFRTVCFQCQKLKSFNSQSVQNPGQLYNVSIGQFEKEDWKSMDKYESKESIDSISILSYNILMDKYDAERIHSKFRWEGQMEEFSKMKPDIICLQEVRKNYLEILKSDSFIQHNYSLVSLDDQLYGDYTTMILVSKNISIEAAFSYRYIASSYSICIICDLLINNQPLRIYNVHLKPLQRHSEIRRMQLQEIYNLSCKLKHWMILGDFNFELKQEENFINSELCFDVFAELNPKDFGFTFDPKKNFLIQFDDLNREKDRFRIDRMLMSNGCHLKPQTIKVVLDESLYKLFPKKSFKACSKFYLSDHFGLLMKCVQKK